MRSFIEYFFQKGKDLGFYQGIEAGGRLIGNDQIRVAGKSDCDHDAFPHTPGELVRIFFHILFGMDKPEIVQQADCLLLVLVPCTTCMNREGFADLVANRNNRG